MSEKYDLNPDYPITIIGSGNTSEVKNQNLNKMKKILLVFQLISFELLAQTPALYVPSGFTTSGIGTSINGNVGIGVASPQFPLEVVGNGQNIRNTSSVGYTTFRLYNDQNNALHALEIDYSGSAYAGSVLTGSPAGEGAAITTTGAYPLSFGTSNTSNVTIMPSGNVGIGTQSPLVYNWVR